MDLECEQYGSWEEWLNISELDWPVDDDCIETSDIGIIQVSVPDKFLSGRKVHMRAFAFVATN